MSSEPVKTDMTTTPTRVPSDATVIICASNEAAVISRTLTPLSGLVRSGMIRLIVVCNGCTDRTAEIARMYDGVIVTELDTASKSAALREGDRLALQGPRIYLDADIVMTARACTDVISALRSSAMAARPPQVFDTARATPIVRRWYRGRQLLPSVQGALWGAGCYALSAVGRQRFGEFPDVVADDLFIDSLFDRDEISIVDTDPLIVTTPRRLADLVRTRRRVYRSRSQALQRAGAPRVDRHHSFRDVLRLMFKTRRTFVDLTVYVTVIAWARTLGVFSSIDRTWERDESSRS